MFGHFCLDFLYGNGATLVFIDLIEEEPHFFLGNFGRDIVQKFMKLLKVELAAGVESEKGEQFADVDVLRIDHESEAIHDDFQLVLDFFVIGQILIEMPAEDGMCKDLIPLHALLLAFGKRSLQKIFGVW